MIQKSLLNQTLRQAMEAFMMRSMHDFRRFVKSTDLSSPQISILMHLGYREQCSVSEVSERMDITPAAGSQLIEKLVHSGLVERTEDPLDRRTKQLRLSEKGREMFNRCVDARSNWVDELAASLTPGECEEIVPALEKLLQATRRISNQ